MDLKFLTCEQIKYQTKQLTENYLNNQITNEFAINFICSSLFSFDKECDKSLFIGKNEKTITRDIRDWLRKNRKFKHTGFLVDSQSENEETNQEGYYDLKFQHSNWKSDFIFECKLMDETKIKIKEYIYRPTTYSKKADGGLYRFLINKYAANKEFGGMIGFVVKGKTENVIRNVKNKISELIIIENSMEFGQLTESEILNKTITGNRDTFLSEHVRWDKDTNKIISPVLIYHIFFDMANNGTFN